MIDLFQIPNSINKEIMTWESRLLFLRATLYFACRQGEKLWNTSVIFSRFYQCCFGLLHKNNDA